MHITNLTLEKAKVTSVAPTHVWLDGDICHKRSPGRRLATILQMSPDMIPVSGGIHHHYLALNHRLLKTIHLVKQLIV
jgi:hypothetical protein